MEILGLQLADFTALCIYLVGVAAIGLYASRKVDTDSEFFMGGRSFGKLFAMMHQFGTGTHADHPVGVSGKSYKIGLAGIWYQWVWLFVTPFYWLLGPILRRMRYMTTGDFFAERYGAGLGQAYAMLGVAIFMLNMGIMLNGTGRTIDALTEGAIPTVFAVVVMTVLLAGYSIVGGLTAAVVTDAVQGVFIIILSFMLMPYVIFESGGFAGLHDKLSPEKFSLTAPQDVTLFFVIMTIINAVVNIVTQPHVLECSGVAKDEDSAAVGFTYGSFIKRFCTIAWAFIGLACIVLYPNLEHEDLAFGVAARNLLPVGLAGVMIASMMAAVMSSCDSFMVDAAALFTRNLHRPHPWLSYVLPGGAVAPVLAWGFVNSGYRGPGGWFDPRTVVLGVLAVAVVGLQVGQIAWLSRVKRAWEAGEAPTRKSENLAIGRIVAGMVVAGGIGFALAIPSVAQGLKYFWVTSALMGPGWWLGVIWRRMNRYGAWAAFLSATGAWLFCMFVLGWSMDTQAHWMMAVYLPISFLTGIVVSLATPPEPHRKLRDFYMMLRTPVGQEDKLREKDVEIILE